MSKIPKFPHHKSTPRFRKVPELQRKDKMSPKKSERLRFPTISVTRGDKGWEVTRNLAYRDPMEDDNFRIQYDKVFLNSIPDVSLQRITEESEAALQNQKSYMEYLNK